MAIIDPLRSTVKEFIRRLYVNRCENLTSQPGLLAKEALIKFTKRDF